MTLTDIIAVPGYTSRAECMELMRLATGARRILEVGRLHGRSTAALLLGMPIGASLVSIDHHAGDRNLGPSSYGECIHNLEPFVAFHAREDVDIINGAFEDVLPTLTPGFDLIYYDAMHTPEACEAFWRLAALLATPRCILAYDDADWPEMYRLAALARVDGFHNITLRPLSRGEGGKEIRDIGVPGEYTMMVMLRKGGSE